MTRPAPALERALAATLAVGAAGSVALIPHDAAACGGTFCDAGPQSMPVDQTGENVLFVLEGGTVEAHVQIQYEGDAENFAWIIPVTAEPVISVGSQALFDNLLAGTVPTFGLQTTFEPCADARSTIFCSGGPSSPQRGGVANGAGFGDAAPSAEAGGWAPGDGGTALPPGPDIVQRGVAGAFEFVVLDSGDVDELVTWLDDNGYAQDPDAPPILEEYVAEGHLFVAVKLRAGADVDEIQPLVLEYAGDEPCIPIRLTRIAATNDMGIRAFFLGDAYSGPSNFAHVVPNWARLDWVSLGANYVDVVTAAVDEADGRGFVTEYAGDSAIVGRGSIVDERWDPDRFLGIDPIVVVDELAVQGLMTCGPIGTPCQTFHPLVDSLLSEFLPIPNGLHYDLFYGCLECYADQIDPLAWDAQAFADAFDERIAGPGRHAEYLLDRYPRLTRLFTTISPHEMTVDPMFTENPDLPEVTNVQIATLHVECEGSDWLELPDGTLIHYDEVNAPPDLSELPGARRTERIADRGAPMVEDDFADEIDAFLLAWNAANPVGPAGGCACSNGRDLDAMLSLFGILGLARLRRRPR